jgi:hypothetical protein
VDLAPLKEADRVTAACASALGLAPGAEALSAERVAAQVAGRAVLIVLDNCEHVRDGAAAFADALLSRAGPSRIVATSREPLSVAGEQLCPVRPLSLPPGDEPAEVGAAEAVRVFLDRVRLVQPDGSGAAGQRGATAGRGAEHIAAIELRLGRLEEAEHGFRRALQVVRAEGDVRAALIFLHNLVRVSVAAGRPAAARESAREAERLLREVPDEVLKLELLEVGAGLASLEAQHAHAARF